MKALVAALALTLPSLDLAGVAEQLASLHRHAAVLPAAPAVEELRGALRLAMPAGADGDQLRGDVFAEMARRLLEGGDAAAALQAAHDGLAAVAVDPSPVRALLSLREAESLEALGRETDAVDAYEKTIAIARSLMEKEQP